MLKVNLTLRDLQQVCKNRTAKLNGLTSKTETNSIAPTRGFKATGTPGGHSKFDMYPKPSVFIPTKTNIKYVIKLKNRGSAMRDVTGKFIKWSTSNKLPTKNKHKN